MKEYPVIAVQYHPEASPGPLDARYLFDDFVKMMETAKKPVVTSSK
jgi:carbamoyl-phosphate synthase small subunit